MSYVLDYYEKYELVINLINNKYDIYELYNFTILLLAGRHVNIKTGVFNILQFLMVLNFNKELVWETQLEIIEYFLDNNNDYYYNDIEYIFNYYRFNNFI